MLVQVLIFCISMIYFFVFLPFGFFWMEWICFTADFSRCPCAKCNFNNNVVIRHAIQKGSMETFDFVAILKWLCVSLLKAALHNYLAVCTCTRWGTSPPPPSGRRRRARPPWSSPSWSSCAGSPWAPPAWQRPASRPHRPCSSRARDWSARDATRDSVGGRPDSRSCLRSFPLAAAPAWVAGPLIRAYSPIMGGWWWVRRTSCHLRLKANKGSRPEDQGVPGAFEKIPQKVLTDSLAPGGTWLVSELDLIP